MPSSIKKVILQKQIESTLYQIFPKTDATIVSYTKTVTVNDTPTSVDTTVAAELAALKSAIDTNDAAALAAIDQLRDDVFGVLGDGETIASTFDTIKEIADFLDTHDESIGALANLISDVGIASVPESSVGAGDGTAATGLHADVEDLQTRVTALQAANGTNVSKTKSGSADAGNGALYLDGVLTTIYSDTNVWAALGESTDEAAAAGTTAWSRIKNAENDIDTLEGKVGASTDTASSSGTTLWSRLLALEAIAPTKVEASTTNGNIKIDNVETQVYDDSAVVASIGASTDTANSTSTVVWPRLLNAEGDIDTLESNVGASTDTANSSGTTLWSRLLALEAIAPTKVEASTTNGNIKIDSVETQVYDDSAVVASIGASTNTASSTSTVVWPRLLNAEGDIDTLEASVGASTDTADSSGTTLWSRVKAIEAQPDPVQIVSTMPQTVDPDVLYMLEIQ